ncbi:hydroxyacylglutathione hydrolase [[Haemophilus] ducreyi]|uniref:Hydroxyacylglutathione hydrolase n=2 Tax=Haemophilus ducreyi TaxID=730 RepID=GLO2_HAEDU|nr:hydroxyacylglutathione hydrolase [[Haemophilus] ducreyi]Q7VM19.1 RecName: Full=Hydroxyacylglutathione hydrolase; AltName: Full=Glyoxalase II; Short=Glx II [[Haemophilus] ducreyi 35000HP]AAP96045.1 putative hydroxyacylglutathione hydrolase [[Haemophilus] ducreyi 35000HP]AKO31034.1 hydroxyacylglutathione hydrolase [[Haemophilus] ducreyi]AKO32478.1 hydroxyacylglutathione hydrolase [[Haemophilus] ducreyi]AKO33929.1 hydroxyacylglutathione hydrolase [[Haemophilus] ducreyi]AKO35376.1 hydroxyacylg
MLKITAIPALQDNYIWAIQQGQEVMIVDPAQADPVFHFLAKNKLNLTTILITHYHQDHIGGIAGLQATYPDLTIYGSHEVAQYVNHIVQAGDHLHLLNSDVEVINSAGHTAQHISFLFAQQYLFCGDALFSAGCGRVFTGDYQAQFNTLQRFKTLPESTLVFPAHEYTLTNLKFAASVLPNNNDIREAQARAETLRAQQQPTLPSTIKQELRINPFLQADNLAEFITLRQQKDQY